MTVEELILVFTVLTTFSLGVERFIELLIPLWDLIKHPTLNNSAKLFTAIVAGMFVAYLFRYDVISELGIAGSSPVIGYFAAGLIASTGSTVMNRILGWLKTLKNNTTTIVTEKTVNSKEEVTREVVTASKTETIPEIVVVIDPPKKTK